MTDEEERRSAAIGAAMLLVAVAGGTLYAIAPRQTTKPTEIAVKGKPVAVQTRMKLPAQGPRTPRDTVVLPPQKKEVEIPRMRVPPPIMRPEKKKKSKKQQRAEKTERRERPKLKRNVSQTEGGFCFFPISCATVCSYARAGSSRRGTPCQNRLGLACIRSDCPDILRKKKISPAA